MKGTTLAALCVVTLLSGVSSADEVDDLIHALKPSPPDDAAWAGSLVKAAEGLANSPEARLRVYEKAYECGLRTPQGYPSAVRAARALMEVSDEGRRDWREKLLEVYRRDWQAADRARKMQAGSAYVHELVSAADGLAAAGDLTEAVRLYTTASHAAKYCAPTRQEEIAGRLQAAKEQQRVAQMLEGQKRILAANPQDRAARERLIRLHVVEFDDAAEAARLLTEDVPQELRTYVPLAAKGAGDAPKDLCAELGAWYESLTAGATLSGQANVLARAQECHQRVVDLEDDPVRNAIAKAKLAKVAKALAEVGPGRRRESARPGTLTLNLGGGVTMEFVLVPAGSFSMGSPEKEPGREPGGGEGPQHKVTIGRAFYLATTEVTVGQFAAFAEATGYRTQAERDGWAYAYQQGRSAQVPGVSWRKPGFGQTDRHPVVCLSWDDAAAFCKWLSAKAGRVVRLPTEAEWEYACKAGSTACFSFGDDAEALDEHGWYLPNSGGGTHPTGQKRPNAFGLHDMHGNATEWCADWFDEAYYGRSPAADPAGPDSGSRRVRRGGSWTDGPGRCRSAWREPNPPGGKANTFGFRVVTPEPAASR